MITPRSTRLLRAADLQAVHHAIAGRSVAADPLAARGCAVLVPTRGAAEALRQTLERRLIERGARGAFILPALLTRAELYVRLHERLPGAPFRLSDFEREVLFRRAARVAGAGEASAPFRLRPGLIVEILAFYDELRRRHRTVADFDRLMTDSLSGSVDFDRGAERMLRLTRFLVAAFTEFERSVAATGAVDEHGLRALLLADKGPPAFRHLIITVADQAADSLGLWTADYDLFARLAGLETVDIIATENVLAAGFHQRIHDLLPGIEEERCDSTTTPPVLVAPETSPPAASRAWFVSRDREEELADVARAVKATGSLEMAVVFQRPLPYLYLARHVFRDAEVPYQAMDALPLAAEPFAAAVDLLFTVIISEATRASLIEVLGSPHWRFADPATDRVITRADASELDTVLKESKYLGGWDRLSALDAQLSREIADDSRRKGRRRRASAALSAAAAAASRLRALGEAPTVTAQIETLLAFIRDHERLPHAADPWHAPHLRARAAVLGALQSLALAHQRHDDAPLPPGELAGTVRRWIEGQTFSPRTGVSGILLLDAPAAAFADLDEMRLVGLVETDWPDRGRRNIFYPASLLSQLGWPDESDRLSAARARFRDLLRLPHDRVSVSTFTLEDDAIVAPSVFLEELDASGLAILRRGGPRPRVFLHEAFWAEPPAPQSVRGPAAGWLALRMSRSAPDARQFHGAAGRRNPGMYAVSHVERYLECPFKYFAAFVLRVEEEREDESGLNPRERGQLLHDVFERFFKAWQTAGRHSITAGNLPEALALFREVAEDRLGDLSEADRALERTYLLGSAASVGLAERALAFEIEHGVSVIERLLEYQLEGEFEFKGEAGHRRLHIRAKADRIDLLADGTLRVIDYKLGRAPRPGRALQLPVYGVCAAQHLEGRQGRSWTVSRAGYVAFREKNAFVPLGGSSSLQQAMDEGQERLVTAVDGIESGEFPPRPDEPFFCSRCGYATVCRKDYVGDE